MMCYATNCDRAALKRGLCDKHVQRLYKWGDPNREPKKRPPGTGSYANGYLLITVGGRTKREHVVIAEKAIGRELPAGAAVHHVDGDRGNNAPSNLVICPSDAYHKLIHSRQRAFDACGNANALFCRICKRHDATENMRITKGTKWAVHKKCWNGYMNAFRNKRKNARLTKGFPV